MNDCRMAGIPWDEPVDRVLHAAGVDPPRPEPTDLSMAPPHDDWVMLRLVGGPHDGQLHTMPADCQTWVCGDCRTRYA